MPPVCTAGFGVASGQWGFVGGALYLYTINCVFIALATVIGIRVLRLKRHGFADAKSERRVKLSRRHRTRDSNTKRILCCKLVNAEVFKSNANKFITWEFALKETQVASSKINSTARTIEVALIGRPLSQSTMQKHRGDWQLRDLMAQN